MINQSVALIPRYILEFITIVALAFVSVVTYIYSNDFLSVIPQIGIFGVAGLKLLPALQQVYVGVTRYNSNSSVVDTLYHPVVEANKVYKINDNFVNSLEINKSLDLKKYKFLIFNKS